jgi:hypothetical protein
VTFVLVQGPGEIVFLDAFVPDDGDSVATLTGGASADRRTCSARRGWCRRSPGEFEDADVGAWSDPRRAGQPVRTCGEPVRLEEWPLRRTYVRAARARTSPAWRHHEIATTHTVPGNRPAEPAALLAGSAP